MLLFLRASALNAHGKTNYFLFFLQHDLINGCVSCLLQTSQSALKLECCISWCSLVWHSGQFHWWERELQRSKASNDFSCLNWIVRGLFCFWFCFGVLFTEKLALFIFTYFAVDTSSSKFVFDHIKKKNFKSCPVRLCEGSSCICLPGHVSPCVLCPQRNHISFATVMLPTRFLLFLLFVAMVITRNSTV